MKKQYLIFATVSFFTQFCLAQPGSYDPSLAIGSGANSYVLEAQIQTDGKIVLAGNFTEFNTLSDGRIDRINANGSVDMNYNGIIGANEEVKAIDIQNDGKIIVGGNFTMFQNEAKSYLARLESDGTLDFTFTTFTNGVVHDVTYLSSGKILIAGEFTMVNGLSAPRIARLNSDGTLDATFTPGLGADQLIRSIEVLNTGKIIIAGDFSQFNGTNAYMIARLNSDGTHDTSFSLTQVPNGAIYAIAAQTDGQVLVSGAFTQINGITQNRIARLSASGAIDPTFQANSGSGIDGFYAKAIEIQNDGKIIVGGYFIGFNGTAMNNIVRLNANGSIDPTFQIGSGPNSEVRDIQIQSDGKLIVSGYFSEYDGHPSNSIVRLNGGNLSLNETTFSSISLYPNPSNGTFSVKSSSSIKNVKVYNSLGKLVYEGQSDFIQLSEADNGMYVVKIETESAMCEEKLIINN